MSEDSGHQIVDPKQDLSWKDFEEEVAVYFERSLPTGVWGLSASSCRVRRKPAYFSKDRDGDIVFDVSIEVFPPDTPEEIHFLWLIECKNYPSRNVKVDEVEEFHRKMMQVGAHKGVMMTRFGFDSGALKFAKTNRVGLCVLKKRECVVMQFSASGGVFGEIEIRVQHAEDESPESLETLSQMTATYLEPYGVMVLPANLGKRRLKMGTNGSKVYYYADE